jgi:hypothetical protein
MMNSMGMSLPSIFLTSFFSVVEAGHATEASVSLLSVVSCPMYTSVTDMGLDSLALSGLHWKDIRTDAQHREIFSNLFDLPCFSILVNMSGFQIRTKSWEQRRFGGVLWMREKAVSRSNCKALAGRWRPLTQGTLVNWSV